MNSNVLKVFPEECMKDIHNKFELVLLASSRSKSISNGACPVMSEKDVADDKPCVIAMREIAGDCIAVDELRSIAKSDICNESSVSRFTDIADQHYVDINAIKEDSESDGERELQDLGDCDMNFDYMDF